MRAAAIVTTVLGLGTALVFALAIAAFELFPDGGSFVGGGGGVLQTVSGPVPMAVPAPIMVGPGVMTVPAQPVPVPATVTPATAIPTSDPASPSPAD